MRTDRNRAARFGRASCLVLALCTLTPALPEAALAQAMQPLPPLPSAPSRHAGTLTVPMNKSEVVSTDRPIAKALIGNDDIADVLPISDRSVYVLGKKMGTTSLTLQDSMGRVLTIMDVAVGPDVDALTEQLHALVPDEQIEARISNDSIVLTGVANDAGAVDRAVQLAQIGRAHV